MPNIAWSAALLVALAVTGCAAEHDLATNPPPGSQCTIYDKGESVRLTIEGPDSDPECQKLSQSLSSGGSFWTAQQQGVDGPLSTVCVMASGSYTARIDDSGEQLIGTSLCGSFVQSGWTEDASAEQAVASQAEAEAAASESAAALQQDEQEMLQAAQAASADRKTIKQDLGTLAQDEATANKDISEDQAEYGKYESMLATAKSKGCDADGDTNYESTNVSYDDNNLDYDINTLDYDNDTLNNDLNTYRTDLENAGGDRTPTYVKAAKAIKAIKTLQQQLRSLEHSHHDLDAADSLDYC